MSLRIVQIVEKLEVGGLERFAVDLGVAQKQAGHASSIYCVFRPGVLAPQAEEAGVKVRAFHKAPGFSWANIRQMADRLRQDRADVVHTHNSVIHHYGLLAARLAGVPVVVNTRHGLGVLHTSKRQELYFRATMPFTGAVVCVCEDGRKFFTTHRGVPVQKCHVILNGIPLEKYAASSASPGSRGPGRIRFGTVGRMVPAKAHHDLIAAFALVLQQLPEAELVMVGDGPLQPELERQAVDLGISGRIRFLGARQDIPEQMTAWDVFAFSSISEGLPIVILEAMAAGLPIVSTRIGGVPEVAPEGKVAWYCEPGRPTELARLFVEAAHSGCLAEMGKESRRMAFGQYSIGQTAAQYEELFRRLLPSGRSKAA